ncbi:hypothetical protein BDN70DRAFT_906158 [Pholiota conissans]|uniref:Uncharacterized protein n=1 Tax=Pholiota conissans TaxID=109636 RepID=A0A9P6CTS7_9AGAR|nr:hypothetical protein BDN70DRAFT_906158 [Pholiota conissans]
MSVQAAPSSSTSRGDLVLQPNYFTSSIYVKALRDDISTLILRYHEALNQPGVTQPFAVFKTVWTGMGWHWLQFRVFDSRSRHALLETTTRLCLERTIKTEAPFTRAVSLFATYLFFYTQVKSEAPPLHCITNIPIACDHYASLVDLADSMTSPTVSALQPHIRYILSRFRKDLVFLILPKSELGPMNPRELPREIYADGDTVFSEAQKRKGRPARREKGKKARVALEGLENWIAKQQIHDVDKEVDMAAAFSAYEVMKNRLLESIDAESISGVGQEVLDRLKEASRLVGADESQSVGVSRLERELSGPGIFKLCK